MAPKPPRNTTQSPGESSEVTIEVLAKRLGVSTWWVGERVRKGLIPHVRTGTPPAPGKRDTRAVSFTEAQAEKIERDYHASRVTIVEPHGGAA